MRAHIFGCGSFPYLSCLLLLLLLLLQQCLHPPNCGAGVIQGVRTTHGRTTGEPRRTVSGYINICGAPSGEPRRIRLGDHTRGVFSFCALLLSLSLPLFVSQKVTTSNRHFFLVSLFPYFSPLFFFFFHSKCVHERVHIHQTSFLFFLGFFFFFFWSVSACVPALCTINFFFF